MDTTPEPVARPVQIGYLGAPIDPDFDIGKYYEMGKQLGVYGGGFIFCFSCLRSHPGGG
jgi:hypothetical protein